MTLWLVEDPENARHSTTRRNVVLDHRLKVVDRNALEISHLSIAA